MSEQQKPEEGKKIKIDDFIQFILKHMTAEEALKKLLASTIEHYERLKLERQPEDNPESVSPYFIMAAAALDLGWMIAVEDEKSSKVVRGLTVGTKEYMDATFKHSISGEDLASLLSEIHSHGEIEGKINPEGIVYPEGGLLEVLKAIGLPEPKWGGHMSVEEYLEKKNKKDDIPIP